MLSSSKITKKPNKETTQVIPVQERSGLYLVVEPKPSKCKRFEGRMRYPRGRSGKTQYISLGAFNEKTNNPKQALKKWTDIKGINADLFKNLVRFQRLTGFNLIITSFNNYHNYFKTLKNSLKKKPN